MPLKFLETDITKVKADAIVNAAAPHLLGGGGVDGCIHRAPGPQLLEECRTLGGCATGEAKLTWGYRLPCKYVIHTVGPIWQGGSKNEKELLTACYRNSLRLATAYDCASVAFAVISAGVYGYPKAQALNVAVKTIESFLLTHAQLQVYIVLFDKDSFQMGGAAYYAAHEYIAGALPAYAAALTLSEKAWLSRLQLYCDKLREKYQSAADLPAAEWHSRWKQYIQGSMDGEAGRLCFLQTLLTAEFFLKQGSCDWEGINKVLAASELPLLGSR